MSRCAMMDQAGGGDPGGGVSRHDRWLRLLLTLRFGLPAGAVSSASGPEQWPRTRRRLGLPLARAALSSLGAGEAGVLCPLGGPVREGGRAADLAQPEELSSGI